MFFREPADFRAFLDLLGVTARWARWILHDYCLMTNHIHLVAQTPLPTLPWSSYARRMNPSIADVWGPGPDTSDQDGYLPAFVETKSATAAICSAE